MSFSSLVYFNNLSQACISEINMSFLSLQRLLSEEGWKVKFFTDSEEALKHYAEIYPCQYDLVILDIRMPKLNGIQLFYRLKSITSNVKIIFLSALDAAEELASILPGISHDDIIKKPVLREELVSRLRIKLKHKN
ncbi:MAG: response regulator [Nitrososphaeraceae archaeon]